MRLESPDAAEAILIDIHVFSRYSERYFHFSPSVLPLVLYARLSVVFFVSMIRDLCVFLFVTMLPIEIVSLYYKKKKQVFHIGSRGSILCLLRSETISN